MVVINVTKTGQMSKANSIKIDNHLALRWLVWLAIKLSPYIYIQFIRKKKEYSHVHSTLD
ncbi:hypothetical protein DERF_000339 [Dermatophagoides farinae]|uniref:Uncharacterized protein n=1 Tax=Dermatophagoides farinae TaxID=6954 RepID=A0A922L8J8_DERFA|nr:hypothetical protein DERF_000339 [Dermatophagoides farinae]